MFQIKKDRQNEEACVKEHLLLRKQHELEIKEQLNEEARIEFTYKQKELNQRIKA